MMVPPPPTGSTEGDARARSKPGPPDVREHRLPVSRAAPERALRKLEKYNRVAELVAAEPLTETGTLRLHFRVPDDAPFTFLPGQFVGIQAYLGELGYRRSPYCILSPPREEKTFELLIRIVPEGPLSRYLTSLQPGDVISFRGPTGRTMIPKEPDTELILLATGVGIGPFLSLLQHLLPRGFDRPIRLFWGLRLAEDICLTDELEKMASRYPNVTYRLSLSQPPEGWRDLNGRLTETVPPLLETLGGKHFYLAGNGAMIEEMSAALSDLGVPKQMVYEEHYFNFKHRPDPAFLEQLRERFVAADLSSPRAHREALEQDLQGRRANGSWAADAPPSPGRNRRAERDARPVPLAGRFAMWARAPRGRGRGLHRVLRSEELPLPTMRVDDHMRVRREARAMTVGEPAIVPIRAGTTEALLTRLPSGRVVAFTTHCPHQGTPLAQATIYEGTLRCPQHTYLYDLTTGANIFPTCDARPEALYRLKPGYLKIYEVEERDGWIWVSDTPKPPPSADEPSGEAPAVFRVTPRQTTDVPPQPTQPVVHPVEEIVLRLDEEVELEIPTTPMPGHIWRFELSNDGVKILGQQFDPGEQPLTRVRTVGQEAGRVTLRCLYARPWGQNAREIRTYQIEVTQ